MKGKNRRLAKRTYLTNTSKPRCEQFSRSARRDEEIVVDTTMTMSNKAMRENRRNPSGYGHSAPDTASLLLEVASTTPSRRSLSRRGLASIAVGDICEIGSTLKSGCGLTK